MSWTNKLLETYEMCASQIGIRKEGTILLPTGHIEQRAQIEVVLDEQGNFKEANELSIDEATTIIPVTEDSASRANGISPHPLHDKLVYTAGDYVTYVEENKKEYHESYMENLKRWVESPYTHPTIQVIYKYLKKGTLIHDLIDYGILTLDGDHLDKKKKFQKVTEQSGALVRFCIDEWDNDIKHPWEDLSLFDSFVKYYESTCQTKDLCYVSGKEIYCTDKHPNKIRYGSDKAKLISSNDSTYFTFRGRIASKNEVNSMGYETSQKIHNALRWLIQKQGFQEHGLTVLVWNAKNIPMFHIMKKIEKVTTEETYALKVNVAIKGRGKEIDPREDVMIMLLESATDGRLAITGYQELSASRYYSNINNWYSQCNWRDYTPYPNTIIRMAYGTYQGKELVVKDKIYKTHLKRLLPCILMGKALPKEFILKVYDQVLKMSKVDEKVWLKSIDVLCALARRESFDRKRLNIGNGGVWAVSLEENRQNHNVTIDFVLGELMAIYHEIEAYSLQISKENRTTNVMKLFTKMKKYPWRTLNRIDSLSIPYVNKLKTKANTLLKLQEEVAKQLHEMSSEQELRNLKNLDFDFVIGFKCMKEYIEKDLKMENQIKEEQNNDNINK